MSDLRDSLIEAAMRDARNRAEKALAAVGQKITSVQQVSLSDFAGPPPVYANVQRMEMASDAPTQVFTSDQDIRTNVNVTFVFGPANGED